MVKSFLVLTLFALPITIWSTHSLGANSIELADSTVIADELGKIYTKDTVELPGVGTVALWADARTIMSAIRNKINVIQIEGINRGLYQQGLYNDDPAKSVTPAKELATMHLFSYCAKSASNENENYSCRQEPTLQHADIKLSTLLSGFRYGYDDELKVNREDTARIVANNIVEPFPSDKLSAITAISKANVSDLQARDDIAKALAAQALLSVAREPFAEMIAKRSVVSAINQSPMEIMEKEAAMRFLNKVWQKEMSLNITNAKNNKKPEQAVLYEIALMNAYQNWLEYERYRQMERVEALLAATLALNYRQAASNADVLKQTSPTPSSTSSLNNARQLAAQLLHKIDSTDAALTKVGNSTTPNDNPNPGIHH